jgi:uncharacterized protein DUF6644
VNIQEISQRLQSTSTSEWIQETFWVVPSVQTIHILGICIVISSITMLSLRLLGVFGRSWPLSEVAHRFLPWVWTALFVLLLSGVTLILADPERELLNKVFWLKMWILAGALLVTTMLQLVVARGTELRDHRRLAVRTMAALWLVLWIGVAAAGRWIAYFEHG